MLIVSNEQNNSNMKVESPYINNGVDTRAEAYDGVTLHSGIAAITSGRFDAFVSHTLSKSNHSHCLVESSVGNGKTNLLNVLILKLAMHYTPESLDLWLIDTGTTEFGIFNGETERDCRLPHLSGYASTENADELVFMFDELSKVVKSRNNIIRAANVQCVEDYNALQRDNNKSYNQLPRVIVFVSDYYLLFKATQSSMHKEVIRQRITEVLKCGRATGVHLVLASQCASTVLPQDLLDQFRLRFVTRCPTEHSIRTLGTAMAADLNRPGIMYVSSNGSDIGTKLLVEIPRMPTSVLQERINVMCAANIDGKPAKAVITPGLLHNNEEQDILAETRHWSEFQSSGLPRTRRADGEVTGGIKLRAGYLDGFKAPARAQLLSIEDNVHALVLGGTGRGKSCLLHNFICNMISEYSPKRLHLYLWDLKGTEFGWYKSARNDEPIFPHIKACMLHDSIRYADETLRTITGIITRRLDMLGTGGFKNIEEYNQSIEGEKSAPGTMANVVIVIDEFEILLERMITAGGEINEEAHQILEYILEAGPVAGVNLVCACQTMKCMSKGELDGYFAIRYVFPCSTETSKAALGSTVASELNAKHGALYAKAGGSKKSSLLLYKVPLVSQSDVVALKERFENK